MDTEAELVHVYETKVTELYPFFFSAYTVLQYFLDEFVETLLN